ncbi:hypothetical protein Athai_33900 [Actinocatenispora thailandica]|uniref:Uncharacterized protein n=1 Tax=Actinocatenispora thailandica TaxID=227318 RepID=A0A7R7HX71_9ACTN|nr:hypothetical protein Athai_33900 [Actinocatenispora thailandica]
MRKKRGKKRRLRPTRTVTERGGVGGPEARPTERSATVHVGDGVPVVREERQLVAETQMTIHGTEPNDVVRHRST